MTIEKMSQLGLVARRRIDLIRPDDHHRYQNWNDILSAYGHALPRRMPVASKSHFVVAWAGEFSAAAADYADTVERPFREIVSLDDIPFDAAASVFVIGEADRFDEATLFELSRRARKPWGFVSSLDRAGLSFALNKCLAASRATWRESLVAHYVDDVAAVVDDNANFQTMHGVSQRSDLLFRQQPWDAIFIHAHGEPGHARCGNTILCGVQAGGEHAAGCFVSHGCRNVQGKVDCKRGRACGMDAARYGDLRCRLLFLDTCCGMSLGGELFPSDLSSALSVSAGFPAYFISTIAAVEGISCGALVLAQRLASNVSAGTLAWLLNDIRERQMGMRPFVLFGDPVGDVDEVEKRLSRGAGPKPVVVRASQPTNGVVGLTQGEEWAPLLAGISMTAFLTDGSALDEAQMGTLDKTSEVDAMEALARDIFGRLVHALAFERAAVRSELGKVSGSERRLAGLNRLRQSRLALEDEVSDVLSAVAGARRTGIWTPILSALEQRALVQLDAWTTTAAELFADSLWEGDFFQLLTDGCERVRYRWLPPPASCPQASDRHPVAETSFRHPLHASTEILVKECAVCGVYSVAMTEGPELTINGPESLLPGTVAEFTIEHDWKGGTRAAGRISPAIAATLVEKTTYRVLASHVAVPARGRQRLVIKVPEDILLDSHVLQAVWVCAGIWAYSARRIPALPASDSPAH
jgi:hypothetical protein